MSFLSLLIILFPVIIFDSFFSCLSEVLSFISFFKSFVYSLPSSNKNIISSFSKKGDNFSSLFSPFFSSLTTLDAFSFSFAFSFQTYFFPQLPLCLPFLACWLTSYLIHKHFYIFPHSMDLLLEFISLYFAISFRYFFFKFEFDVWMIRLFQKLSTSHVDIDWSVFFKS